MVLSFSIGFSLLEIGAFRGTCTSGEVKSPSNKISLVVGRLISTRWLSPSICTSTSYNYREAKSQRLKREEANDKNQDKKAIAADN